MISHSAPWITDSDLRAVESVVRSGQIARGATVARFEAEIAQRTGAAGAVATASGTAALALALRALGISAGDEVIIPTYVCVAVANAVRSVGARPVLCDVGDHWMMTPETVRSCLSEKTRAIVLVHLFGITLDRSEFQAFGIPLVDDCCQSFGAPGTDALRLAVYSFHATKCLTSGEGGAVSTTDGALLERLRTLAKSGSVPAPMSDLQASLGVSQLARYDDFLRMRREQASEYFDAIPSGATRRLAEMRDRSMFFRFPMDLPKGKSFEAAMRVFGDDGIAVRRGVDALLHRAFGIEDRVFPGAVRCYDETMSIPIRPGLSDAERNHILTRVAHHVGR